MRESVLQSDKLLLPELLHLGRQVAERFLAEVDDRPAGHHVPAIRRAALPEQGMGAAAALEQLRAAYATWMSGSAGPRYFGFVMGGTTPAALLGDWLTSTYDQNLADGGESGARQLTLDALGLYRDLLGLPDSFRGAFVTGATTSATVALATARQWVGRERGVDVSVGGLAALGPVRVLGGAPHSSIYKALSVLGLGRSAVRTVATLPGREAVDLHALRRALVRAELEGDTPCIVVANAGTVNTCDFDDLRAIASLREHHRFWLHVDGAFGAVAAASPRYRGLVEGIELADSVTVDGHKWLNVPYDSAVVLTKHLPLQGEVFRSSGAYLPLEVHEDTFIHLTLENSQRVRAIPTWMTLMAYGREGYAEIVERCCDLAAWLGERMEEHPCFRLLAPVRLNGVCFTLVDPSGTAASGERVGAFLDRVQRDGTTFFTPTTYDGLPAARLSVSNWRTRPADLEVAWQAMARAAEQ